MWVLIIVGVLVVGLAVGFYFMDRGRREALGLTFSDLDFSALKDGTYTGAYKGSFDSMRDCKVEVTVTAGKVSAVKVLEGALAKDTPVEIRGGQTIDALFKRIIDAQSLKVDVISGATVTSNAHLKAVENALTQAGAI